MSSLEQNKKLMTGVMRKTDTNKGLRVLRVAAVFIFFVFAWIFFVFHSLSDVFYVINNCLRGISNPVGYLKDGIKNRIGKDFLAVLGVFILLMAGYDYIPISL